LYGIARYTGIALHTAAALLTLSVGLLAVSLDRGFAVIVAGTGAGSVMTRRLLGFAVLVPLLLGSVRLRLEDAGYFGAHFGLAALVLLIIVILAGLILRTAVRLNQIELQQFDAESRLRDRLQEMETMMEVLPVGVLIATDPSAASITGNRIARELLRMPDRAQNISLTAAAGEAPDHYRLLRNGVVVPPAQLPVQHAAREGVEAHDVEMDVEFDVGTPRRVVITAAPLLDAQGGTRGAIASLMDITARRAAEREREDLLARAEDARALAEAANRAKDEFLATISHELRTPLNAILGWASMLRDGVVTDAVTITNALATIERSCKAQAQLIDDLLDVSRIRAGMLHLDMKPVDLRLIVLAAADVVRPAAEARGIALQLQCGEPSCLVLGDATRLQQVVWNLLANAVKFSRSGGAVEVVVARAAGYGVLTVSDDGQGIDPVFLPYVFERFRQEEEGRTRERGGLGLGLAIAQDLVEMHGGSIEAASDGRGRGARFTVRLPLLHTPAATHHAAPTLEDT
jgi:signal transduction histidine kinase